jgi:predicted transcriptional regulator
VWSLNVEPLNFERPYGFERSKAVERLQRLELVSVCVT